MIEDTMRALAFQSEAFNAYAEIATEKVFCINTSAPGMILGKEAVVGAENVVVIGCFNVRSLTLRR